MTKPYPLSFQPTFKSRIWGGSRLQNWFEHCPTDEPVGEAWVLSDHKEGPSPIANGLYEGKLLHDVMTLEPDWFQSVAKHSMPDGRFPLLIKVIDAADDLSVQVHPNDEYGYAHAGEQGKTECWWVLDTSPGSEIIYGHHAQTKEEFQVKVESGQWTSLLKSVTPRQGDFYFVPSGKLHALGKGTMVLEVQQSSDTTYRVYDYNRTDAKGQPRDLHLNDAMAVTQCPDIEVPSRRIPVERAWVAEQLVSCPFFDVEHWTSANGIRYQPESLTILSIIHGNGQIRCESNSVAVRPGSQVLLPDGITFVDIDGGLKILATTLPKSP